MLCVNPLTGAPDTKAVASQNLGTLKPNEDMSDAELIQAAVPARCDERGFLLIGNPPELGPYVLPGNNYHVYDYRSEEHTSELQSLMRSSYAVFCLTKTKSYATSC